jgi:hypothetical protein
LAHYLPKEYSSMTVENWVLVVSLREVLLMVPPIFVLQRLTEAEKWENESEMQMWSMLVQKQLKDHLLNSFPDSSSLNDIIEQLELMAKSQLVDDFDEEKVTANCVKNEFKK